MGLYSIKDFESGGILSEAYVPKSKYLKRAEMLLDKIRAPYLVNGSGISGMARIAAKRLKSSAHHLYTDRNWTEFEKCLEKQFGFETFTVNILKDFKINAMTYPVSLEFARFANFDDVLDSNGLRYKESAKMNGVSFITDGLLFNAKFTSGQILSIILHEIGHNFSQMAIGILAYKNNAKALYILSTVILSLFTEFDGAFGMDGLSTNEKIMNLVGLLMNTTDTGKRLGAQVKRDEQWRDFNNSMDFLATLASYKKELTDYLPKSLAKIGNMIESIFTSPILKARKEKIKEYVEYIAKNKSKIARSNMVNYLDFMDESFADKFVAMNGYGVEFSTAVKLVETESLVSGINGTVDAIPIIGHLFALDTIIANVFETIISGEPHPTTAARVLTQISILEEELNNPDLNPKTKAIIEKDIKNIKKESERIDKLLQKDINMRSSFYRFYILAFNKFITTIQPDKDIRECLMGFVHSNKDIMASLEKNIGDVSRSAKNKLVASLKRFN